MVIQDIEHNRIIASKGKILTKCKAKAKEEIYS